MPSGNYRYYCLDGAGRLHGTEWLSAENDDAAIAQVSSLQPDSKCEIWQGRRLVAAIAPKRLSA